MPRPAKLDDVLLLPGPPNAGGSPGGKVPRVRWEVIVERIRSSIPPESAAEATGIGASTYYRWMELGEDRFEAGKLRKARSPYREFREAVTRARAEAEAINVAHVAGAAPKDWKAAAFLLERSFAARWRRRDTLHQAGPGEGDPSIPPTRVEHTVAEDAPSKLADLLDLVAKQGARPRPGPGDGGPS